jgi:putative ATP-binding cassette transporter
MRRVILALRTFLDLSLPYFRSEDRWRALTLLAAVVVAELGLVYVAVAVTQWNARFFNALEARDWDAFAAELLIFCLIAAGAIVSGMCQYYFGQTLQIRWRRWLTENYVALWMARGRHYRVRFVDGSVDNIHLRIANDVYLFIQRTHELGTGLLGSIVALASFTFILWGLSSAIPLPLLGTDLSFPGYLVWTALVYAGLGTLVAHWIGAPLIPLNFNQQRYESDFRFAIVRAADHSEPVALMRGEAVEREELGQRFANLVRNWTALVARRTKLTGFIAGYAQVSMVFPTLVASPAYLMGAIPLGTLIQAGLAFQRVEGAFAFCISAYSSLAEWKAIMDRLSQFEAAMAKVDAEGARSDAAIAVAPGEAPSLDVSDLVMTLPDGRPMARVQALSLAPGTRTLVVGPSGAGKSAFFRVVAGLWPSGAGRVALPANADIIVMPQRPYFPLGTLHRAVTYPTPAERVSREEVRATLAAVGLDYLADRLDEEADWSVTLSGGEQQRIAFARALLKAPAVLMFDEPVAALADDAGRELYRTLLTLLPETIVLTVDRREVLRDFHGRVIEMAGAGVPAAREPAGAVAVPA